MDSLTQIVLGGAVGEAVLGRKAGNRAVLWGAVAGTIPDLDVLVKFFVDELTADEMHRGFSHSILFSVLFAPVLSWMAWKLHRKLSISYRNWTWMMFLALVTHPLLDMHTAFGTQLLWPLDQKFTYNNIFVADPLYTLPFMALLIAAMLRRKDDPIRRKLNLAGIYISSAYMLLTIGYQAAARHHFTRSLEAQNISYQELECKPTPLNCVLWCGFVKKDNEILLGYYSLLDKKDTIRFNVFPQNTALLGHLVNDGKVQRMIRLSRGWYIIQKDGRDLLFSDIRFGQTGFNNDPKTIVYTRKLVVENGKVKDVIRLDPKFDSMSEAFGELFSRMAGNRKNS